MKTSNLLTQTWITQPSDERAGAAMIVDSSTESYIVANELDYSIAQAICKAHNEHAALLAVAEAAKKIAGGNIMAEKGIVQYSEADVIQAYYQILREPLANLAAVRNGGAK